MSDEEISEIQQSLARLEARSEARERSQQTMQGILLCLVGAFAVQIVVTVFIAGGKVESLDRVVEDVREIKSHLYQIKGIK